MTELSFNALGVDFGIFGVGFLCGTLFTLLKIK